MSVSYPDSEPKRTIEITLVVDEKRIEEMERDELCDWLSGCMLKEIDKARAYPSSLNA